MAQITASSNIANGNIIQPSDILPLYTAMTSGGGLSVSLSGSITGSSSTSTSSSYALSSSYSVSSSYAISSSSAISSSFATTSSYAANGGIVTQITQQAYSNDGGGPLDAIFKFYAGKVRIVSNTGATAPFPGLAGKTLGNTVWVTATIQGTASSFSGSAVTVKALTAGGSIQFESVGVADSTEVHYHVIYVP